jgi:hypothetical protein
MTPQELAQQEFLIKAIIFFLGYFVGVAVGVFSERVKK